MTPNGWKQLSNIWFSTFWVKLLFAMHAHCMHVWHIHATVDFRDLTSPRDFQWWRPSVFLKMKAFARSSKEILVFTPWSKMLVATFSVNHVCPLKYRTCHSEVEQNSDLHLAWRKIKKENKMPLINQEIAQRQSLYNDLFTDSRKNTFRMWKTTKKWHFIS